MKSIIPGAILTAFAFLTGCAPPGPHRFVETRAVMNAPLSVILYAETPPPWDEIFARAHQIAVLYDQRLPQSPLAQLNRTGTARVPEPAFSTIRQALSLAEKSGGAYDPTILPLMDVWDFDNGGRLPAPEEIKAALSKIGLGKVRLAPPDMVTLTGGAQLDIGGIGEGAVVDAIAGHLDELGYTDYLVDAAGEIVLRGAKPGNEGWSVAVRSPRKPGLKRTDPEFKLTYPGVLGVWNVSPGPHRLAVSTSGDYEKFFVADGMAYAHILDPRTGYPPEGVAAVTVTAPTCAEADSLATAAFVLGFEKGTAFLEAWPGAEGLVVREVDGKLEMKTTSGFPALDPADSMQ